MPRHKNFKDEEIINALEDGWGNITYAAELLGYKSVPSLTNRINKNPVLADARAKADKNGVSRAIRELIKFMLQDNFTREKLDAIKYYLSHSLNGRAEGYGDTKDINVTETIKFDFDQLPLEKRLQLLEDIKKARVMIEDESGTGSINSVRSFYSEN
jgi:hypothetical protein